MAKFTITVVFPQEKKTLWFNKLSKNLEFLFKFQFGKAFSTDKQMGDDEWMNDQLNSADN